MNVNYLHNYVHKLSKGFLSKTLFISKSKTEMCDILVNNTKSKLTAKGNGLSHHAHLAFSKSDPHTLFTFLIQQIHSEHFAKCCIVEKQTRFELICIEFWNPNNENQSSVGLMITKSKNY